MFSPHPTPRAADGLAGSSAPPHTRPYAAPALEHLGTIEAVTGGPNTGNLDQIVGASSGGFRTDGTS